jgi:hypothetical protein
MKKTTLIIVVLLSATVGSMAQDYRAFRERPSHAIYLAYQPWDHGLGIRGDYHINYWAGVYGSASYGEWGLYKMSGLGQHMKLTAGILIPYKDYAGGQFDWTVGINYHKVWGEIVESEVFKDDPQFHNPWSFELGFTCKLERFTIGCRTDILRWEPCIDVGIPIHFKEKQYKPKKRKL